MSEKTAVRTREKWVDDVKVIACILVVLGHFFQSMTKANILPENDLYKWFNTTIYYFHVPLFFICSGYLYQKYSRVNSVSSWRKNVAKKALALGVPYATFTTATWVLKKVFSSSVNDQIGGLGNGSNRLNTGKNTLIRQQRMQIDVDFFWKMNALKEIMQKRCCE